MGTVQGPLRASLRSVQGLFRVHSDFVPGFVGRFVGDLLGDLWEICGRFVRG